MNGMVAAVWRDMQSTVFVAPMMILAACGGSNHDATNDAANETPDASAGPRVFDLDADAAGFVVAFADYPAGEEALYELDSGHEELPSTFAPKRGLRITGNNHSDDLFLFAKRRIDGLQPGRTYALTVDVELLSNSGSDCIGVGGAPGESVVVKTGGTTFEPAAVVDNNGYYGTNFDRGNQSTGGAHASVVGDLANGSDDCTGATWKRKTLNPSAPVAVIAGADGSAWIVVGADSGYEGLTTVYLTRITATLTPS